MNGYPTQRETVRIAWIRTPADARSDSARIEDYRCIAQRFAAATLRALHAPKAA